MSLHKTFFSTTEHGLGSILRDLPAEWLSTDEFLSGAVIIFSYVPTEEPTRL